MEPSAGVYPRVCGGSGRRGLRAGSSLGLSPRVRGKPGADFGGAVHPRSIPACAGEAWRRFWRCCTSPVYPRVCGGSLAQILAVLYIPGLSPRVRGKQYGRRRDGRGRGSIPACAGEAKIASSRRWWTAVYPRVCGGSLDELYQQTRPAGLSPRVRGKLGAIADSAGFQRSIPACAGEA